MFFNRFAALVAALALLPVAALAQTAGSFPYGSPLGSAALNQALTLKQDNVGTTGTGVLVRSITPTLSGQPVVAGLTTTSPGWYAQLTGDAFPRVRVGLNATDVASIALGSGSVARDTFIERAGPGNVRFGAPDAAAPVAQTDSVQNVLVGTTNFAGASRIIAGSQSTGSALGGSILLQVSPAGSSGSTLNALATAVTIAGDKSATFAGPVTLAQPSALGTPSSVTLTNAAGLPISTGVSGLGASVATFLATPTSANLAAAVTDETGTGANVFANTPTLVSPVLGAATGTSLALGGATIGSNALAVTGTSSLAGTVTLGSASSIAWPSSTVINISGMGDGGLKLSNNAQTNNAYLVAEAANMLSLRNGVNAQTLNVYNTTNGTDSEFGYAKFSGNVYRLGVGIAGAGTQRALSLETQSTSRWQVDTSGNFIAATDNTYDIGASGANRPRNIFAAGGATIAGNITATAGGLFAANNQPIGWASNSGLTSGGTNGVIQHGLADAAAPVAQTIQAQSVVAGTSNTAGANFTIAGSKGTGTGAGGHLLFQAAKPGSTGSTQNALTTFMDVDPSAAAGAGAVFFNVNTDFSNLTMSRVASLRLNPNSDAMLTSPGTAIIQYGLADAASPVAQTITAQSVAGGTSNTSAPNLTIDAPKGTGTGAGGSFIVRVAAAGSTGSTQNAEAAALTIDSTKSATFGASITVPNNATAANFFAGTGATNGYYVTGRSGLLSGADGNWLMTNNAATAFGLLQFGGATASFPAFKRNATGLDLRLADDSGYTNLVAGALFAGNQVQAGAGSFLGWAGKTQIFSSIDGNVQVSNNAGTNVFTLTASGSGVATFGGTVQSSSNIFAAGLIGTNTNSGKLALGSSSDVLLSRPAAATLQHGDADAAAPVAQTVTAQSVVAGTTNTAGANFTIAGSKGTGTGAGGSILFQVAPAGSTGSAQNAMATALTIASDKSATFTGNTTANGVFGVFLRSNPVVVSGLQTCNSGNDGLRQFVTDATTTTFAGAVTGSGANHVPVYCDGSASAWKIG